MLSLISKIFENNKFTKVILKGESKLELFLSNGKSTNFIVCQTDNLESISEEFINSVLVTLKKEENWSLSHLKNTFLLILFDTTDISQDLILPKCQQKEEDKYAFKKQVLDYNQAQLSELSTILKKEILTLTTLNLLINNPAKFKSFANENNFTSHYELLLKIFIKLPFLTLETRGETFSNLKADISSSIGQDFAALHSILREYKNIDNLDDEEITEQLLKEIEDEKN